MVMLFRRREIPWEVVDSKAVDPVPLCFEDNDLELVVIKPGNVRRKYVVEVRPNTLLRKVLRKAVIFAQEQLLQEIIQNGYNILLSESWQVTLLRRGNHHRIEVEYTGRPARASNAGSRRYPPYMAVLQDVISGHASEKSTSTITKRATANPHNRRSIFDLLSLRIKF